MKILSIDTASNLCTVAILEDEKCIKELIINDIEKMKKLDKTDLVEKRYEKFRNISGFKEV